MAKSILVRDGDPAVRAWLRSQAHEEDQASVAWLMVPFRMFVNVSFLGTLLQMQNGGMALKAALGSAMGAGLAFAAIWLFVTWWCGGDLPQIFIRSLLIFGLTGMWFTGHLFLIR